MRPLALAAAALLTQGALQTAEASPSADAARTNAVITAIHRSGAVPGAGFNINAAEDGGWSLEQTP